MLEWKWSPMGANPRTMVGPEINVCLISPVFIRLWWVICLLVGDCGLGRRCKQRLVITESSFLPALNRRHVFAALHIAQFPG